MKQTDMGRLRGRSSVPMCQYGVGVGRHGECFRKASVLSTDACPSDTFGYTPVCKVHLRMAITAGLARSAQRPAGYRVPLSILPLDAAPSTASR